MFELFFIKRKAEQIITALEEQVNTHLIKLACVAEGSRTEQNWRQEVTAWLARISAIRLKPQNRPGPASFYFRCLFDEPYGPGNIDYVRSQIEGIGFNYEISPAADATLIHARLGAFHMTFAHRCFEDGLTRATIIEMVIGFGGV